MKNNYQTHEEAAEAFYKGKLAEGFIFEKLYTYRDASGNIIYWRIRLKHPDGTKWIRPMCQDKEGYYRIGEPPELKNGLKPLYGLDLLAKHANAIVIVVEGENVVDALNDFLFQQRANELCIAITSGSATSAESADWQPLQRRRCIVWPDNDASGSKYAEAVHAHLSIIGFDVTIVDVLSLGLNDSEDFVDWVANNPNAKYEDILKLPNIKISHVNSADTIKKVEDTTDISMFPEVKRWPHPINPSQLLDEIASTIERFIICPRETLYAVTLWIAMTWFIDVIDVAPLAVITAPEKRCGKSKLLGLMSRLVNKPLVASNITPSAVYRSIELWHPTWLIDEADTFVNENEELRGVLNSGHTRETAFVVRNVRYGQDFKPARFSTWGAKALSGIGSLNSTLMDRAIKLELRRKLPTEQVERSRQAEPDLFKNLSSKLARFSQDYAERIRLAKASLPDSLNDREQDNWEPLLAIAKVADDAWVMRGWLAALKLSGHERDDKSINIELLEHIKEIFENGCIDRIYTEDLIKNLAVDKEKPWLTYNQGAPINPRQLAGLLKGFGIKSGTIRISDSTGKGYMKSSFDDAFARYIPMPETSVTASQPSISSENYVTDMLRVTNEGALGNNDVTDLSRGNKCCDVVTDNIGGSDDEN